MKKLKPIDLNELKKIQLQILDAVAIFCEENKINYWLDSGTLIGAVRHKGYIPWDDDIDIAMLRVDYEKFMRLFNAKSERYKVYNYENNKKFYFANGKVLDTNTVLYEPNRQGLKLSINIDIFIYDNAPDNPKKSEKMYRKRDRYNKCETAYKHKGKAKGSIFRRLLVNLFKIGVKLFPRDYFVKRIVKNAKSYNNQATNYVGDFTGCMAHFMCEKTVFNSFIDAEFEGGIYKIPVGYDRYLRLGYGDYMQLPPEEERISHHKFEAFVYE